MFISLISHHTAINSSNNEYWKMKKMFLLEAKQMINRAADGGLAWKEKSPALCDKSWDYIGNERKMFIQIGGDTASVEEVEGSRTQSKFDWLLWTSATSTINDKWISPFGLSLPSECRNFYRSRKYFHCSQLALDGDSWEKEESKWKLG